MVATLINTGSELLLGQALNTHVRVISDRLMGLGLRISRQLTIPDGEAIRDALRDEIRRAQIVIVTGGLGPTSDDVTREMFAEAFGLSLEFSPAILTRIQAYFDSRDLPMPDRVKVQAQVPQGTRVLPNNAGTAPGLYLEKDGHHIFCLPGPGSELIPMFDDFVMPILREITRGMAPLTVNVLRVLDVGESRVQEMLELELAAIRDLEIGYCSRPGEVDIRFLSAHADAVAQATKITRSILGEGIYAQGEETLEQVVIRQAKAKGLTLAVAESCTGGLIAHRLTSVPGASEVFLRGWVCYSNEGKIDDLGVHPETLRIHGAVSAETVRELALGAFRKSGCTIALATTGIAGPSGGTPNKPVGLLFIGLAVKRDAEIFVETQRKLLVPRRDIFQNMAAQSALNWARMAIKKIELPKET